MTSSAGHWAKAVGHRTIFLKCSPCPQTLLDRRAILRAMFRFGSVSMFKQLEDPRLFICLTTSAGSAEKAIANAPIRITVEENTDEQGLNSSSPWNKLGPSTFRTEVEMKVGADEGSTEIKVPSYNSQRPSFIVRIFDGLHWPHKRMIQSSLFHGAWPNNSKDDRTAVSYVTADLSASLPPNVPEGLHTWDMVADSYNHSKVFYSRRKQRKGHSYLGAVPELMTSKWKFNREAGLLGDRGRRDVRGTGRSAEDVCADVEPPSPLRLLAQDKT